AFRHKPVALPRQQGREQPYGQTTQQEGCLRRKALVLRGLRHERVHDHEDREHGVQRGPDEGQQRGERLHSSSPPAALAGATRGAGASDALARPVVMATTSDQRASVYRRWSRTLMRISTIAATCRVEAQYRSGPGTGQTYRPALARPVIVMSVSTHVHVGNENADSYNHNLTAVNRSRPTSTPTRHPTI